MRATLSILAVSFLSAAIAAPPPPPGEFLGLTPPPTKVWLGEGPTDHILHPKATGTLSAIMLFAAFPDGEEDLTPQQLYDRLVPGAVEFFDKASYGKCRLEVTPHFEWQPMTGPSTDPVYDCSKHDSHERYIAEVVAAADDDVDFRGCDVIYVVANRAPGVFNSPTFNAHDGDGFTADGHEVRTAVTFGNDIRQPNWGWQTLVHETGHVLGLPDLYGYANDGAYKNLHRFTGSWDPMGYQCHSRHFLAWHKHKLGWLDEAHFEVVREGTKTVELSHIETDEGIKAVVLPISVREAYVAEVRHLSDEHSTPGVLIYRVSLDARTGEGPITVMPARPDDDKAHPQLARRYIALYDALHRAGDRFGDAEAGVEVVVRQRPGESGFEVHITR